MHFGREVQGTVQEEAHAVVWLSSLVIATLLHGDLKSGGRSRSVELHKAALGQYF